MDEIQPTSSTKDFLTSFSQYCEVLQLLFVLCKTIRNYEPSNCKGNRIEE